MLVFSGLVRRVYYDSDVGLPFRMIRISSYYLLHDHVAYPYLPPLFVMVAMVGMASEGVAQDQKARAALKSIVEDIVGIIHKQRPTLRSPQWESHSQTPVLHG